MQKKQISVGNIIINLFFIIFSLCFILPLILIVIISFSSTTSIIELGYTFFPSKWSTEAYEYIFKTPGMIWNAYKVTIIVTIVGTAVGLFVMSMISFVLSRNDYALVRPLGFFVFFAMLFNAGMIPTYIIYTRVYHLKDSLLVLILPGLVNCWNVILMRTFLYEMPDEILEAASIDGCNQINLFFRIVIPMSTPILATIGLMTALGYWNQWMNSMIYIDTSSKYMLQYLLYKILKDAEIMMKEIIYGATLGTHEFPTNSAKMAMAVIAAGPMMFVFPFFQKYFVRGLTTGAVKG